MKAKLHIDGKAISIDLSFEDISQIVSNLPDVPENSDFFEIFSAHPSASVRESVAGKDNLNGPTVQILANDKCSDVLRRLVRSDNARDCLDTEQLLSIIDRDIEAAKNIASYVESYGAAEVDEITAHLQKHPDPQVRAELAGNSSAPKKALRNLLKDEDSAVRYAAKRSLD